MSTQGGNADRTVIIPAMELSGTRASKLAQIDALVSRLLSIRLEIAGDQPPVALDRRSRHESSARAWWLAGAAFAALFVLLTIWAWMTGTAFGEPATQSAAVAERVSQ